MRQCNRSLKSLALGLALVAGSAGAQVSGNMNVTLNLVEGCVVNGSTDPLDNVNFGTMAFGSAPTLFNNDLYAQATLSGVPTQLVCSPGATLNITVGGGLNENGGTRRMISGGGTFVEYQLRTAPAGGGALYAVGVAQDLTSLTGTGAPFDLPIYGVVAPQTGLAAGAYSDTVGITLSF